MTLLQNLLFFIITFFLPFSTYDLCIYYWVSLSLHHHKILSLKLWEACCIFSDKKTLILYVNKYYFFWNKYMHHIFILKELLNNDFYISTVIFFLLYVIFSSLTCMSPFFSHFSFIFLILYIPNSWIYNPNLIYT